jgi:serine/threonine protein kinase
MENGNIRQYIQRNPDADRVRLLSEVASGVEFLHESGILHGDLCDKNVLINRDGKAIVCGFDLFKFSNQAESRTRWLSPERITPAGVTSPTEKADIWSFGLLCLEVFTGEDPYHSYSDQYVSYLLIKGTHPEHPGSAAVGLSPKMWDVMQSCWQSDAARRPSMSEIQSTIRDMLPRRDPRQQAPGSIDFSVPIPFTPTIETAPPNEAMRTSSPLSPLTSPTLIEISPVLPEPNTVAPTSFLRTVDQQTDTRTPIMRRRSDSPSSGIRRLPPLPEGPPKLDIPAAPLSAFPQQPTTSGGRKQERPSTAPNSSPSSSLPSGLRRQLSVDSSSSSSQSTSSTTGSNKRRLFLFSPKRSQTTPDTSPGVNSDTLPPGTPSSSNSFILQGAPPATPPSPNKSRTMPTKKASKMMARQPSRSTTYIVLPQSRKWEPVSPVVLNFMDKAASDSECLLRFATDGTVSAGNLEGLVSRVISDIAASRDDRFRATFLTIYQLFATSERLFGILKRRFESTELDPITVRSRYPILLFIESWLKKGFEDGELKCSSMIKEVVFALVDSETVSETMEAKAREILNLINDPEYVPLRQPNKCSPLRPESAERPPGVTPADWAAALTVVEGDRFKCITYWDYVNFTRQPPEVRRIEVFNIVHDLVTVWVQTTVLHSDFLEERMKMYEEWVYTAEACRGLNNFSSTSAIVIALMSPIVTALVLTCESRAKQVLYGLAKDLTPTDGVYQNTLQKAGTKDLIPWLDPHLSTFNSSFAHSNPTVEVDGHFLIDFKQCSEVAEQIESLVQYSPPRTRNTTRPDVLAYVEYSLKSRRGDDIVRTVEKRSADLAGEEQSLLEHRKKMKSLGFAWSPPRRKGTI